MPAPATNTGNWNLFHFRGGEPSSEHGLWDVSLSSDETGELSLYVYDFLANTVSGMGQTPAILTGTWFELELYLRRAADATGEIALYQNGEEILRRSNVSTDDTTWGRWFVGNLAGALMPPDSTVYVDDVAIRESQ